MAYQDIATVQVSLQTAGVSAQGFGVPLFASSHRFFTERVRSYTSLTDVANDFPADSAGYKAAQQFFGNTPRPSLIKLGRREADVDLTVAAGSTGASLAVTATNGTDTFSVTVNVTGQVDEDAVATAVAAAIEADADVTDLVAASASTNVVSIDITDPTYAFTVKNLSDELSISYNTTETAPELISAISLEDDDYYFFAAEDHSDTFVMAAAADIEARLKLYFTSTAQQTALTAYVEGSATDTLGKLADAGYFRTHGQFHHLADTEFPECKEIGYNAPFKAGSVTWSNLQVSIPVAQDPATGLALNSTQKGYLNDRNAAYVDGIGGLNILRGGKVASGERIDNVRGRDNLSVDLDTEYTNFLVSQQGGKVPYNNTGITQLEGICKLILERYVTRGFINSNYVVNFPREDQVPTADKQNRIYQQGTFEAELTGAIEIVSISGILSLNL